MIIPWLKGFLGFSQAPLTWVLILMNFFIFTMTLENDRAPISNLANAESLELTGRLYHQFLNPGESVLPLQGKNQWMILGGQGLRDPGFIGSAPKMKFFGDDVAIKIWKQDVATYNREMSQRFSSLFGLNTETWNWTSWITYQFMHASVIHLASNMFLFLIFGAALEMIAGGLALILIYLLSGLAGGLGYFYLGGHSMIPMIGASGALTGVMAFYAIFEIKKRVSFFYFVSPLQGYFGWIYLPTLLILPLCFLPDVVGYLSTPSEIGAGIAYTAHIGGAAFGLSAGFICRVFRENLRNLFHATKPDLI